MSLNPPRPPSPPLNALRAFEAAARLGGFSRAADELCVTAGAVAQQVKQLEEWVGAPLFRRHAQGVQLTDVGKAALPDLTRAFDLLIGGAHSLRAMAQPQKLRIAALPAIAQLWLPERLARLRQVQPDLEISITVMETAPNLAREPFDISLFMGVGDDVVFPVAAPQIADRINSVADIVQHKCLIDTTWSADWDHWFKAVGHLIPKLRRIDYSLYAMAVQDAIDGVGVLMGRQSLVRGQLERGQLVAVSDLFCEIDETVVVDIRQSRSDLSTALAILV